MLAITPLSHHHVWTCQNTRGLTTQVSTSGFPWTHQHELCTPHPPPTLGLGCPHTCVHGPHTGPRHTIGHAKWAPISLGPEARSALFWGHRHVCAYNPAYMCLNTYNTTPKRPTLMHKWTHNIDTYPQGSHTGIHPHMYNTDFLAHSHT